MNYEKLIRKLRQGPVFEDGKRGDTAGRVLRKALAKVKAQSTQASPKGPYSGLTRKELSLTGTCEPDWY